MARESYVRPVVSATEPPPRWLPVWRFRIAALVLLALLAFLTARGIQVYVLGTNRQDPGVGENVTPTPLPS